MNSYGAFAAVYDALTANADYPARAALYDRLIDEYGGKKGILLDLACGTGSMSFLFAGMGYDVIGVDASEAMLSEAAKKRDENGLSSVLLLCQRMEELDLYGTVDVTVCALDSLNHLTDPELLKRTFARVSLFTNPGGLFLFDVNTPYKHREVLGNNAFLCDGPGVFCAWQNTLLAPELVQIDLELFIEGADGRYARAAERFCERAYPRETLAAFLDEAGFELLTVRGESGGEPPEEAAERLVFAARKR